jgi:hypothetical protein
MRVRDAARLVVLLGAVSLPGCRSLFSEGSADLAGVAGAGAASAVTDSAAAAAAIGLGVRSIAAEGVRYTARRVHRVEQDRIAAIAGAAAPGAVVPWSVHDRWLEGAEGGNLVVSREFGAGAIRCREVVFSVERLRRGQVERAFYLTTICQDGARWRWASAEPATERWGGLQ